jgi:hypothetical protein
VEGFQIFTLDPPGPKLFGAEGIADNSRCGYIAVVSGIRGIILSLQLISIDSS